MKFLKKQLHKNIYIYYIYIYILHIYILHIYIYTTPHKTAAVRPPTTHLLKHPSYTNQKCVILLEK